jgi:hypothetical protein
MTQQEAIDAVSAELESVIADSEKELGRSFTDDEREDVTDEILSTLTANAERPLSNPGGTMTPEQRNTILERLTANCSCEDDKAALNSLGDETLLGVLLNAEMPAFIKKKIAAKKKKEEAVDEEDMEEEEEPVEMKKGATKNTTSVTAELIAANAAAPAPKAKTMREFEATMPPEVLAVWNSAKQIELRERKAIVDRLTVNVTNPDRRKSLTDSLMGKPMGDLVELLAIAAPPPRRSVAVPEPLYTAASAPNSITGNANTDDDLLPLPSMSLIEK